MCSRGGLIEFEILEIKNMDWLNLHTSILDSPEVVGAEPVDRGSWLMLLRYCIGQECGGIITDCASWKDRKWQQLARVTLAEVRRESDLWEWQGDNLVVWGYPAEKETQVRQKRETARTNGRSGGRPKTNPEETDVGYQEKPTLDISEKAEGERKEKEKEKGNGKELFFDSGLVSPQHIVDAYPRREGVAEALGHVAVSIRKGEDPAAMLTGTRAIAAVIGQLPSGHLNAFVVGAAKFFKNERWRDDPQTWLRHGSGKNGAAASTLDLGGRKIGSMTKV